MTPYGFGFRAIVLAVAAGMVAAAAVCARPAPTSAQASPIRIAVCDFELNHTSGGSGIIPQDATDTEYLKLATEEARRMLGVSGRYSVVDTGAAGNAPKLGFQSCQGCESELAKTLGADQ